MLSGEVAERYGHAGLPDDTIRVTLTGTAGQSFGAFLATGHHPRTDRRRQRLRRQGLSGGRIIIAERGFPWPAQNIIVGNTVMYGATRRIVLRRRRLANVLRPQLRGHRRGRRGWRPWLRIHDRRHGRRARHDRAQFAAGMSGGIAYVLDEDGSLRDRCNLAQVAWRKVLPAAERANRKRKVATPWGAADEDLLLKVP